MLRKPKAKYSAVCIIALALALFGLPLVNPVVAADGANGYVSVSAQIFHVSGAPIAISMWNLDVSSDYLLNWTGDNTGISFTTGATETTHAHTHVLTSSSTTVTYYLRAQSAGTIIDQVQVPVVSMSTFLATSLIISAGIFILIVYLFKRIVSR